MEMLKLWSGLPRRLVKKCSWLTKPVRFADAEPKKEGFCVKRVV